MTTRAGFYALADQDGRPVGRRTPGTLTHATIPDGETLTFHADDPIREHVPDAALVPDPYGLTPPGGRIGFWTEAGELAWTSPIYQLDPDGGITFHTTSDTPPRNDTAVTP